MKKVITWLIIIPVTLILLGISMGSQKLLDIIDHFTDSGSVPIDVGSITDLTADSTLNELAITKNLHTWGESPSVTYSEDENGYTVAHTGNTVSRFSYIEFGFDDYLDAVGSDYVIYSFDLEVENFNSPIQLATMLYGDNGTFGTHTKLKVDSSDDGLVLNKLDSSGNVLDSKLLDSNTVNVKYVLDFKNVSERGHVAKVFINDTFVYSLTLGQQTDPCYKLFVRFTSNQFEGVGTGYFTVSNITYSTYSECAFFDYLFN